MRKHGDQARPDLVAVLAVREWVDDPGASLCVDVDRSTADVVGGVSALMSP